MSYKKVGWEDSPSSNTPILSVSLNQMDDGIEKANKGIVISYSATFTADNVLKNTRQTDALGVGDFATSQTDITTAYVSNAVTKIGSGTFANCTSLKTIYIDNTVGNVEIVSGAVPDGVSIVYSNDDNFINVNELLASAIKSLKSLVNENRTDWENRATSIETQHKTDVTELSQTIQKVKESALEEFASVKADLDKKENVSNKVNTIDFPSTNYYPSTKAVWDYVTSKLSSLINDIATLNNNKVNVTDYNIFKDDIKATVDNNTNAIKTNATDIATNSKLINQNAIKVTTDKSTSIVLNDSSDSNIVGLTLYGKSTQSEVPMPNSPIGIQDTLNPTITVTNDIDTQSIQLNYSLRSVGDICDKIIVNENGDGYIERNVGVINLKSIPKEQWMKSGRKVDRYYAPLTVSYNIQNYSKLLCTHFEKKSDNDGEVLGKITANATNIGFTFAEKDTTTMEDWVSFINNNDVLLYYILSTPTVTQLTQEQVNNILSMYTNYPNTCALSNCDFQLTYVADTKHYIDNKFNELATALVAHESEVM